MSLFDDLEEDAVNTTWNTKFKAVFMGDGNGGFIVSTRGREAVGVGDKILRAKTGRTLIVTEEMKVPCWLASAGLLDARQYKAVLKSNREAEKESEPRMKQSIEVPVNIKMCVDESTAQGCLKIVEMFVNSTGRNVIADKRENGEVSFSYEPA